MKKIFSIFGALLMSAVVFAGGIADPKSSSKIAVIKKDNNHFKLIYKGSKISNVEVSIFNSNNELKFSETIHKVEGFVRPYDFSNLEKGNYKIVVKDSDGQLTEEVSCTEVELVPSFIHVIKLKEKTNGFMLMVNDRNSDAISVLVKDEADRVVYEGKEKLNEKGEFSKVFNFGGAEDKFTFSVTDEMGITRTVQK